jgi:hypothetical protein
VPVASSCSVFARQEDRVVLEVEDDFVERKVGEFDLFREHGFAVAVLAAKRGRVVGPHLQFP